MLLQHPLGVAWSTKQTALYVADTYNHKLKRVTASGKKFSCVTVCGGQRGNETGPLADARVGTLTTFYCNPDFMILYSSGLVLASFNSLIFTASYIQTFSN